IMVQARQLGLNVPFIGGNGMNSVKVFDLAKGASDGLWVGSPWSIENRTPANNSFIIAYTKKYSTPPDQFAAQAYDAMHIAAEAMKKIKFSGDLAKDREALQAALPAIKWNGATGPFVFRRVNDASGKPAGYDANQTAIVSTTRGKNYEIER
ncbi:MAG: ABC transporter substrate-binding protein, partial [Burkholderiaceae bacterium]